MKKTKVSYQQSVINHRAGNRIFELNLLQITLFLLFFSYCFLPDVSYAHKVSVYAYAEDGKVFAEGYFVDGSKAKNSLIEVFDAHSEKKLLELNTNDKGEASFHITETAPLKLVITAGMGHKNDYTLSDKEVRDAMGISNADDRNGKADERKQPFEKESHVMKQKGTLPAAHGLSSSDIETIVDRALEKKLKPIKDMLLRMQEFSSRPGITEILGGVGYIVGLMGIIFYFKSRK